MRTHKSSKTQHEYQIRRSQNLSQIGQRVLEHRGRILRAQGEIVDVKKSLSEIRQRLHELSG